MLPPSASGTSARESETRAETCVTMRVAANQEQTAMPAVGQSAGVNRLHGSSMAGVIPAAIHGVCGEYFRQLRRLSSARYRNPKARRAHWNADAAPFVRPYLPARGDSSRRPSSISNRSDDCGNYCVNPACMIHCPAQKSLPSNCWFSSDHTTGTMPVRYRRRSNSSADKRTATSTMH